MIAIIGAGISGLSVAYSLSKRNIDYKVFEASSKVGGNIRTVKEGGYIFEEGPNSLLLNEEHLDFIKNLGLESQLIKAKDVNKNRYIFKKGAYRKLPSSPPAMLFNSFFSWKAKWSVFKERGNKSKPKGENETVASFFERRLCREIVDYAVNPFIGGIYAGDPEKLLIEKTFPSIAKAEKEHGSIIKGMMANKGNTKRKETYSFKDGLGVLPQKMAEGLNIALNTSVESIRKENDKYIVVTDAGEEVFDKIVLAAPASAIAAMVKDIHPSFSNALKKLYYPPMCCVHSVFKKEDIGHPMDGFGGLNPKVERQYASGSIWTSSIFPNRTPKGEYLITTFVGGTLNKAQASENKEDLLNKVTRELQKVYDINGYPVKQRLTRWQKAIPQYDINIVDVAAQKEKLAEDNIFIAANWLDGVAVFDCIDKGIELGKTL